MTGTLYYYNMALEMGGLMEDPYFHPEYLRTVHATSLKEAKDKWAEVTGFNKKGGLGLKDPDILGLGSYLLRV